MNLSNTQSVFLQLLKGSVTGIGHYPHFRQLSDAEWHDVHLLAERQGMAAILMGELEKLPKECLPSMDMLMNWLGQASHREITYQMQMEQSCEFANALATEGVKCLVLKGLALGTYYPIDKSREFGDLDCFLLHDKAFAFDKGNEIGKRLGARVEQSGYMHTHIHYKNLLIENHEFLTHFNETQDGIRLERILRTLAIEDGCKRIGNSNLWIPRPEFNVLFLLKHSVGDFIANDMTIKAIYDWAVFLKAEQRSIDWKRMELLLDECKMRSFFDLMTEAAMSYLGLTLYTGEICITSNSYMTDCMMEDVLNVPVMHAKKTLAVKAKRLQDRVRRMTKYHTLLNDGVMTTIWNTFKYRHTDKLQLGE